MKEMKEMKENKIRIAFRLKEFDLKKLKRCSEIYWVKYTELIRDIVCEWLEKQDI